MYVHNAAPNLEELGVRIRNWECSTSNTYKDAEGRTQFYLPGDPNTRTPGFTDFPDLPGQSLNPILDEAEAQ